MKQEDIIIGILFILLGIACFIIAIYDSYKVYQLNEGTYLISLFFLIFATLCFWLAYCNLKPKNKEK